jgi:CDGSH-type Zn-finger protein
VRGRGLQRHKKKYNKMAKIVKQGKIKSQTSPKGGNRACLCKDGKTYNVKCCDGTLQAQGIGSV